MDAPLLERCAIDSAAAPEHHQRCRHKRKAEQDPAGQFRRGGAVAALIVPIGILVVVPAAPPVVMMGRQVHAQMGGQVRAGMGSRGDDPQ
jgi:hypothetical protein